MTWRGRSAIENGLSRLGKDAESALGGVSGIAQPAVKRPAYNALRAEAA